jgi:hypothetical protein
MNIITLKLKNHIAKKQYDCDASEWITNYGSLSELMDDYNMPFSDRRKLVIMNNERYKIFPGTEYEEHVFIQDGEFCHTRGRLDAIEICRKYDLWCMD